jgi:hypothetical protein
MSYEVYDDYREHPKYKEFMSKLHKIVNQIHELKENFYNQSMKVKRSNRLSINNDVYMTNIYLSQQKLDEVYALEREYGFLFQCSFY